MNNISTAIWSAIAASFSALSSFMILLIHRRNLHESVRPELIAYGWQRHKKGAVDNYREAISFKGIKNVGRGHAIDIFLNVEADDRGKPIAFFPTTNFAFLTTNEGHDFNGEIELWWVNVPLPKVGSPKWISPRLLICYSDSRGFRYETRYHLLIIEDPSQVGMHNAIAPGVVISSRKTIARSPSRVNINSRMRRISFNVRKLLHWQDSHTRIEKYYVPIIIILIIVAAIGGFTLGGYKRHLIIERQFELTSYSSLATNVNSQVQLISLIEDRKYKDAKSLLENQLDVSLASLSLYDRLAMTHPNQHIFYAIDTAKKHRMAHPNHKVNETLTNAVNRALKIEK